MIMMDKKRHRKSSSLVAAALLVAAAAVVDATKHSFTLRRGPSLIGPVGVPFGFLAGGTYELNVYDFSMEVIGMKDAAKTEEITSKVEAGFYLQRFENEAHFNNHMALLRANASLCVFEPLRDETDDAFPDWDDDFVMGEGWTDDISGVNGGGYSGDGDYGDGMYDDYFESEGDDLWRQRRSLSTFNKNNNDNKKRSLYYTDDDYDFSAYEAYNTFVGEGILLSMRSGETSITYTFQEGEEGLYFLIYQVCPNYDKRIRSSFELDFHFKNFDSLGHPTYLTAGELPLPILFFFFAISYLVLTICWCMNNRDIERGLPGLFKSNTAGQPVVYPIHHLMSALLLFKFLATFFESLRYHAIRVSGHADVWSVFYYVFTFIKGTFLFVVILLIGTGWSFVKPFLTESERKVIFIVLGLQVMNNIALVVLSQLTEGEKRYDRWTGILHVVDILCCCAVLIPIIWSINSMEKTVEGHEEKNGEDENGETRALAADDGLDGDGEEDDFANGGGKTRSRPASDFNADDDKMGSDHKSTMILSKLRLFRSFYLLVLAYIYATRILIYLFATMLSYRYLWVQSFVIELVTLVFYVVVGLMFRPMSENPYLSVKQRLPTVATRKSKAAAPEKPTNPKVSSVEMVAKKD